MIDDRHKLPAVRYGARHHDLPARPENVAALAASTWSLGLQAKRRPAASWTDPSPKATRSAHKRAADRRLTRRIGTIAVLAIAVLGVAMGVV